MYKLYAKERNKQNYDYIKSFEEENKMYYEVDKLDTGEYKEAIVLENSKCIYYKEFEKKRCDKCKIELNEEFIQQGEFRTYRLCKTCNDRYLQYMENIKKLNNYEKKTKR